MKRIIESLAFGLLLILMAHRTHGADIQITATVAFTNGTVNGETITCNADVRTWTNSVVLPASQVLTNASANGAAGNLFAHLAVTPFSGVALGASAVTNITLRAATNAILTVTVSSGWAVVAYSTNTVGVQVPVLVPLSGYLNPAQRTNVASSVASMINDPADTYGITKFTGTLSGTNFSFASVVNTTAPTNIIVDFKGANCQKLIATNDVNIQFTTNGPGEVVLDIMPGGANRLLTVSTNWTLLDTNYWTQTGVFWWQVITNASNGNGPRRFSLFLRSDDATNVQTNTVARGVMSP